VKTIKLILFIATGGGVIGIYAVAPFTLSLRPLLGGLLLPAGLALTIVSACAAKIVMVLRRTAPFTEVSSDRLMMPVVELEQLPRAAGSSRTGEAQTPGSAPVAGRPVADRLSDDVVRRGIPGLACYRGVLAGDGGGMSAD
jgi:hypothetical protein